MYFDVIGLHPNNILKIALHIFDNKSSDKEKIKALLNNRSIKDLDSVNLPANFISGKTIDLNLSELLGIGCVSSYFNWNSEEAGTNNTYQGIVGVEDSAKQQIEALLSDGAVWHDQAHTKMLAQQVMVQGYYPEKLITSEDVVTAIKKKNQQRDSYPENCMLIVNIFGKQVSISRSSVYTDIKNLANSFTDVYIVVYNVPALTMANVSYVSEPKARGLTIGLKRYEYENEWRFKENKRRPPRRHSQ